MPQFEHSGSMSFGSRLQSWSTFYKFKPNTSTIDFMRASIFLLITMTYAAPIWAQGSEYEQAGYDTLRLHLKPSKKVLAYSTVLVTFWVDYDDFAKEFYPFYKLQAKGMRSYYREKRKGHAVNPDWEHRFPGLEAFYKNAVAQAAVSDTIRLEEIDYTRYGFRSAIDFDLLMDKGRCVIEDQHHIMHDMILRKKKAWQKGPLQGWGGRLYYLPGSDEPFFKGTDWNS